MKIYTLIQAIIIQKDFIYNQYPIQVVQFIEYVEYV